ncbi:MAG TPA: inositol oxygenase family protein [Armatimonadota bacterium]|nr:inositol oxygenase family protein [Armatimonadota bacterium]
MSESGAAAASSTPLRELDEWEEFLERRYPQAPETEPADLSLMIKAPGVKTAGQFRDYRAEARPSVKEFYRLNHEFQTLDFVLAKKREYLPLRHKKMGIWEAMEFLNTLVDDSDPDVDFSQIEHLMQTSEAIRKDGHPRWFILTGLIHDLGKILCLFGEPQWCVVGDTFPVGCAFSEGVVFAEFFANNPDNQAPELRTRTGIYEEGCGLDRVHLSWGHDEYLYQAVKDYLPEEALYMIRYHSFYACHREREYEYLMNDHDRKMFESVRAFNPYDLYSKGLDRPNVAALRPYYEDLIAERFPAEIQW